MNPLFINEGIFESHKNPVERDGSFYIQYRYMKYNLYIYIRVIFFFFKCQAPWPARVAACKQKFDHQITKITEIENYQARNMPFNEVYFLYGL